jgi:hypothetical protein
MLAPPPGLSQLATSFLAWSHLGIPRTPLPRLSVPHYSQNEHTKNHYLKRSLSAPTPELSNSLPRRGHKRRPEAPFEKQRRSGLMCGATLSGFSALTSVALGRGLLAMLQKGGDPAAGSPTATLLRLRPSHRSCLRPLPLHANAELGHGLRALPASMA